MISVKQLSYRYPGAERETLKQMSFTVEKGEIFGFLGPSGSGKSTTQKLLYGMLRGYDGSASILNRELSDWDHQLYRQIGVCFELPNHYLKLSARENLNFFAGFYEKKFSADVLLDSVGLREHADMKVAGFSKGMKMRLNFIRSILHDPDILFLDEPTSGLDPTNARLIKNMIRDLKEKGKTIFLTTHQMHDAEELCDRVAFVAEGEIRAVDSPANFKLENSTRFVEVITGPQQQKKVYSLDNLGHNPEFFELLRQNQVESIHSTESTLEEIFIKVTGKELIV